MLTHFPSHLVPHLCLCNCEGQQKQRSSGEGMAWPRFSENLASLAAPLLGDLLCFCSLVAAYPLHLAYILFFSPYLLSAFSFLRPLLLSTCFLLLALLTVSPYLRGAPPSPPPPPPDDGLFPSAASSGPFSNTLRLLLNMLDPCEDGEPGVPPPGAFCDIASELQACVDFVDEMYRERGEATAGSNPGSPGDDVEEEEEKRIVAEAVPSNELFGWELEAISKLYKALTYEVEEFPIKLALRGYKEGELLPAGIGFHGGNRKLQTGEPRDDVPRMEAPCPELESRDHNVPSCDGVDIPLGNASESAIKSGDCKLPARRAAAADCFTGDNSNPPKQATLKSKGVSRSDSDGSRSGKLLRRSSSSSSTSRAGGGGLSRVASAGEWRGIGSSRGSPQGLSSSVSMRKEKEWRRTLACKLYEERIVADGGEEGMDLLWEAYELGSRKDGDNTSGSKYGHSSDDKGRKERQPGKVAKKSGEQEREGEEEEEEEMLGRLCCLQALRFSTAKMSLGMGRSGLLKVSKAVKGVGVLRRGLRSSRKS